uniref:Uncharacterized protein n=1 Tax=Salix viminalis TaxID=40686 RepID=A0A6N2KL04_SALVM
MIAAKSIFCGSKLSSRPDTLLKSAFSGSKLQCGILEQRSRIILSSSVLHSVHQWMAPSEQDLQNLLHLRPSRRHCAVLEESSRDGGSTDPEQLPQLSAISSASPEQHDFLKMVHCLIGFLYAAIDRDYDSPDTHRQEQSNFTMFKCLIVLSISTSARNSFSSLCSNGLSFRILFTATTIEPFAATRYTLPDPPLPIRLLSVNPDSMFDPVKFNL